MEPNELRTYEPQVLAKEILAQVEREPDSFDMGHWVTKGPSTICGTVACVAGWAAELSGFVWGIGKRPLSEEERDALRLGGGDYSWLGLGGFLLGLSPDVADALFYTTRHHAIRCLRHLAEHGSLTMGDVDRLEGDG
jgi:hypothetical protein